MFNNALDFFGGLAGLGVFVAGLGVAFTQFKTGANKAKDELVITYKEQLDLEKEKNKNLMVEKETLVQSHQTQINDLNKQMGILQGTVEAYSAKIKEYSEILQGRSPEQVEFMKFMTQVAKESNEYIRSSSEILKEIKDELYTRHPKKRKALTESEE